MRDDERGRVYQPQAGGFRPMSGGPGVPPGYGPPGYGPRRPEQPTRILPPSGYRQPPYQQPPPYQRPYGEPPRAYPPAAGPPRRRRFGRALLAVVVVLLLIIAGIWTYLDVGIDRVPALADYSGRPAAGQGTNWLIVGSDSREGLDAQAQARLRTGDTAGKRTDTIMIAHLSDGGARPTLLSIPRDLEVDIPGHGRNKVNAAFAFGGAPLLVQTVERFTGLRMDHYAEIGFGGFATMVDAIGGVELDIPAEIRDEATGAVIPAGHQKLDGADALAFVRTRKSAATPRSDLDRVANQRMFIGAFVHQAARPGVLLNPLRLVPLVHAIPNALILGEGDHLHHLVALAWAMRGISSDGVLSGTLPVSSSTAERLDQAKARRLFDALRTDKPVTDDMIFR
jgi:LCP family protein required for cell wall assembly